MRYKIVLLASILFLTAFVAADIRGQWSQTMGPYGGSVSCFAVNGTNIFAGSPDGGVYLSNDNGASWRPVNTGLTNMAINALATLGTNLFAATNGGVFLSTDSGAHWSSVSNGLINDVTDKRVFSLTVSGTNIFAYTNASGSFETTNNGTTWTPVTAGFDGLSVRAFATSGQSLYALAWNDSTALSAISYSGDNGLTWRPIDTHGKTIIEHLTIEGSKLIAVTYGGGLAFSSDSGANWNWVGTAVPYSNQIYALNIQDTTLVVASDEGIFHSRDQGVTWIPENTGLQNTIRVFALTMTGTTLFAGTEYHGVLRSTDSGLTWEPSNFGLMSTDVQTLAASGENLFFGSQISPGPLSTETGLVSTDNGLTWGAWDRTMPDAGINTIQVVGNRLLASTDSGLFRSMDNGSTWTKLSTRNDIVAFSESGSNLFGATGWNHQVVRSTDGGISWKDLFTDEVYNISAIASIGNNLCATTTSGIFVSTDYGATWLQSPSPVQFSRAYAIVASGSMFYVSTGNGVYRTTDAGSTWTQVNYGLTDTIVTALVTSGSNLFAGTQSGKVFLTTNNGTNWTSVSTGLGNSPIGILSVSSTELYAGTLGAGLWRRPLSEFASVGSIARTKFSISSYPNPFTSRTTIRFTSSESGTAHVSIVNLLGAEVAKLFSGEFGAGEHAFNWDASGMPTGMYLCVLRSQGGVERLPMMVVK